MTNEERRLSRQRKRDIERERKIRLTWMADDTERKLALDCWAAQDARQKIELKVAAHFWTKLRACSTVAEARLIVERFPGNQVDRSFMVDYVRFVRDWSVDHKTSEARREARKAASVEEQHFLA